MDLSVSRTEEIGALAAGPAASPSTSIAIAGDGRPATPVSGGVQLSLAEQRRRQALLQDLLGEHDLDGLLVVGNDYRGHKGTIRWVTDYNLPHRHGFAFVARGREPELILPQNMAHGVAAQGWETPVRYARRAVQGVVNAINELPSRGRIGIVGLGEIMRVADAELLRRALPSTEFVDVTLAFEVLRARSPPRSSRACARRPTSASAASRGCWRSRAPASPSARSAPRCTRRCTCSAVRTRCSCPWSGERLADGTVAVAWGTRRATAS